MGFSSKKLETLEYFSENSLLSPFINNSEEYTASVK